MISGLWFAVSATVIAGLLVAVLVIILSRKSSKDPVIEKIGSELENTNKRLSEMNNAFISEIGKVREDSKEAVLKMSAEMQEKIHSSLADGRGEMKSTIESLQKSNEQKLEQIRENVEAKLTKSIERSSEDFSKIAETFTQVNESVKTFTEIGKDISNLSDILASPKLRGNFGEFTLESLISEIIPKNYYRMQHEISKGLIVDAVIKTKDQYLCIDSKFPLENYNKAVSEESDRQQKEQAMKDFYMDVKKHITSIKNKYIVPEKTLDFAFMFIPAESVYYEIVKDTRISKYAFENRVVPVSPNTFFAYLQIINLGFKGMQIEEEAKDILKTLQTMSGKIDKVKEKFEVLGGHLDRAKSAYTDTSKRIEDVESVVSKLDYTDDKRIEE